MRQRCATRERDHTRGMSPSAALERGVHRRSVPGGTAFSAVREQIAPAHVALG